MDPNVSIIKASAALQPLKLFFFIKMPHTSAKEGFV
jgi:hypothetical protein